jgi:hypothetical protein
VGFECLDEAFNEGQSECRRKTSRFGYFEKGDNGLFLKLKEASPAFTSLYTKKDLWLKPINVHFIKKGKVGTTVIYIGQLVARKKTRYTTVRR